MKLKMKKAIVLMAFASMNASQANEYVYVVKKHDTLSNILYLKNLKPIYGKSGMLAHTLRLNPHIKLKGNGNKIYPGMRIILVDAGPVVASIQNPNSMVEQPTDAKQATLGDEPTIAKQAMTVHESNENFEQSTYWILTPTLSWKNLSSTDDNIYRTSQIDALSNMSYGLAFTYGMHFEEGLDIYSKLAIESASFIEDRSIQLEKKDFLTSRFNVGVLYDQKWNLAVGMNDEFFLTSPAANRVEVKKIALPEIKLDYQKDFYQYKNAKLAYMLSGVAILPKSTPELNSEFSYGGGFGVEARLKNQSFAIGYELKLLKATGNSTDNHNIFWNYTWKSL